MGNKNQHQIIIGDHSRVYIDWSEKEIGNNSKENYLSVYNHTFWVSIRVNHLENFVGEQDHQGCCEKCYEREDKREHSIGSESETSLFKCPWYRNETR